MGPVRVFSKFYVISKSCCSKDNNLYMNICHMTYHYAMQAGGALRKTFVRLVLLSIIISIVFVTEMYF